MEDFVSKIQFSTAIPFGYLIFSIAWFSVMFWAAKNIFIQCWKKNYFNKKLYLSFIVAFLGAAYLYSSIIYSNNLDMNPSFKEEHLLGSWEYNESNLELHSGGTAKLQFSESLKKRTGLVNGEGYWYKYQDFTIIISSNVDSQTNSQFRVIKYADSYRIIVDDYDDPDMWDGHLGFKLLRGVTSGSI